MIRVLVLLALLVLSVSSSSFATEVGDAYIGIFGGYQEKISPGIDHTWFSGLKTSIYQPTLNWGDYYLRFIGFYQDSIYNQWKIGCAGLEVSNLFLYPGYSMNAFMGDGGMRFVTPHVVFEHLSLPGQSIRGTGIDIETAWGRAGIQAGRLTEGDYLIPEAVNTTDEDLAGAYIEWRGLRGIHLAGAFDSIVEDGEDRFLSTLYASIPASTGELRIAAWHDTLSERAAAVGGLRRSDVGRYWEAGLLYIPAGFNYIGDTAQLPSGETLIFGTYRRDRVRHGYYLEGSGGQLKSSGTRWLTGRGSTGIYYRLRLRDIIRGGFNLSYQISDEEERQTRLQESISFTHRGLNKESSLRFGAIQLLGLERPTPGEEPREEQTYRWLSEFRSSHYYGNWNAGYSLSAEHVNKEEGNEDYAVARIEGGTIVGFGISISAFVQYNIKWEEGEGTSHAYGGGMEITSPLPNGWELLVRGRAQKSKWNIYGEESVEDESEEQYATADIFVMVQKRIFWGKPTSVIGKFKEGQLQGTGEIGGRVFADFNENGIFDAGDRPFESAMLRLDDGYITFTDKNGLYRFSSVASGEHHLDLDPASFPLEFDNPRPEGSQFRLYPRDERIINWPLKFIKEETIEEEAEKKPPKLPAPKAKAAPSPPLLPPIITPPTPPAPPAPPVPEKRPTVKVAPAVDREKILFLTEFIYFDFDRFSIRETEKSKLERKARWLKAHPSVQVLVEGYCDERGTEDYNLALGQRRAEATRKYLIQLGIDPSRIQTASCGEADPIDPHHNEEAWAKNRRVQFRIVSE